MAWYWTGPLVIGGVTLAALGYTLIAASKAKELISEIRR